ncbi:MAG: hypothetical protein QOI82_1561 [Actinomycetota bacterium]|jgi:hypothetical protein|nr:hypothetical protein [Actinomycetota bacterium]
MDAQSDAAPLLLIAADVVLLGLLLSVAIFALGRVVRFLRDDDDAFEELPVRRCVVCGVGWRAPASRRSTWVGGWLRRRVRRAASRMDRDASAWALLPAYNRCPSCLSTRVRLSRLSGPEHEQALIDEAAAVRSRAKRGGRYGKAALVIGAGLLAIGIGAALL